MEFIWRYCSEHIFSILTGINKRPGPGSHSPEKVYANKPRAPKFSMGIRHSEYLTPLIVEVLD